MNGHLTQPESWGISILTMVKPANYLILPGMNSNESEHGDGNLPPKKPTVPSEAQDVDMLLASQQPRKELSSEESDSDSSLSIGEDLGEQLRLAEERACDFSGEESSNNKAPSDKDPSADQPVQEPKVVFSTYWSRKKVREVFRKQRKKQMKKVSFMCPVAKVITAVRDVHLDDTAQPSNITGTTTSEGSGLNASDVVPMSGDTETPAVNHTVEPMDTDTGSDGANMIDRAARKARMASLQAELDALKALEDADEARIKAQKDAEKATLIREQLALSTKRKQQGLSASAPCGNGADLGWPNYCRKDKPMLILRSQITDFLSELGVPVEMVSLCSWGTLTNIYGALMLGLHESGLIQGIDERLDKSYFTLHKSMRSVFTYVEWQAPALVDRIREEASNGYKRLLGGKYLATVTLATSPTSHTPGPIISKRKDRSRLKPVAMKAPHRRVSCEAPSSSGSTIHSDSSHVRQETEAATVEPAVASSVATESSVQAVDRPSVSLEETAETPREGSSNPRAVGAEAINSSSDLRGEVLRIARVTETKNVVEKWISNATKRGLDATSRVDYNVLRFSLREKLKQAGLPKLKEQQEWAYARQVMDLILPAQRRAGHYKPHFTDRPGKRARQSTAQSPPAGKARRARQSTAQPSPTGYFKRPKKKKKLQQNNNTASHSSASSSAPAAAQRAPVSQAGDNSQGRNRSWKRSPYQRGDPSPHKGSSSSSWKRK